MRIGYSFWGFLGAGVIDTPDGGRSHRRLLLDRLVAAGNELVLLQPNRDLHEAGELIDAFDWDSGLPELDLLVLEWRWEIPGRNDDASIGNPGWTPDLQRQGALLVHYTMRGVPTAVWDKDLTLGPDSPLRRLPNVQVFEAGLFPSVGARSLLFPVNLDALRTTASRTGGRSRQLVYIGNQYGRDDAFDTFIATPAQQVPHAVFGKWTATERWPWVHFHGRIGFADVQARYEESQATVGVVPPRYEAAGQMTQRLPEATRAGCVTLVPRTVRGHERMVPEWSVVASADDVLHRLADLRRWPALAGEILDATRERLRLWDVERQIDTLLTTMEVLSR